MSTDTCPPLYVPTRSECNAMLEQMRREMLAAGLDLKRWNLDASKCCCGSHIEDVEPASAAEVLPAIVEPLTHAALDAEYHDWQEYAGGQQWTNGALCDRWSGGALGMNCQRPPGHNGSHAAVLGMDPDASDWVRWSA